MDGIFYPSRHHNNLYCVAIFDRARHGIEFTRIWGVLGESGVDDLYAETLRILKRFAIRLLC